MEKVNTSNICKLSKRLKDFFKNRINISTVTSYSVEGTIDDAPFSITYIEGECLIISVFKDKKNELLGEILPLVSDIIKNVPALSDYNTKFEDLYPMANTEWYFKDTKERLKRLANDCNIHDLSFRNGENPLDYTESKKIYGLYPGNLRNVEEANNYSEVELYLAIDRLSTNIHRHRDAIRYGKAKENDIEEKQYALEYLVYLTRKFGVELPLPSPNSHIMPTESYWRWIGFYDHHFKHVLSDQQWYVFQLSRKHGIDITHFLPKGSWQDEEIPSRIK